MKRTIALRAAVAALFWAFTHAASRTTMVSMRRLYVVMLAIFATAAMAAAGTITSGNVSITAYESTAGAICSLKVGGYEYIDSFDHGRCLQSAVSFDNMGEAFNPTEAGAEYSVDGPMTRMGSSRLLNYTLGTDSLSTEMQMAFWRGGLSNHVLRKWVKLNYRGMSGAIEYKVSYSLPPGETHSIGQFETLTGYMTPAFTKFYTISTTTGQLVPLSDGPGEQSQPILFSTADGSQAIAVWSPNALTDGGYGRWTAAAPPMGAGCQTGCTKWNTVIRISNPTGTVNARNLLAVGTKEQARQTMINLYLTEHH